MLGHREGAAMSALVGRMLGAQADIERVREREDPQLGGVLCRVSRERFGDAKIAVDLRLRPLRFVQATIDLHGMHRADGQGQQHHQADRGFPCHSYSPMGAHAAPDRPLTYRGW